MAQSWANHLAHTNAFMYKPGETRVGQNLYCRLPNSAITEVTGEWRPNTLLIKIAMMF